MRAPVGAALFLAAFAALACALSLGIPPRDGELATAAFTLSAPTGAGATLFALLGKAAALVPLGELAARIALLAALAGAACAYAIYRAVRALAGDDATAGAAGVLAAALALADGTLWRAATSASPRTLEAALAAAALWLAARATDETRERARAGRLLALTAGLAAAASPYLFLWLAAPAALVAVQRLRRGDRWPRLGLLGFAASAAASIAVPLAAAQGRAPDAGQAASLAGWLGALSSAAAPHGSALVSWVRALGGELGPLAIAAALVGAASLSAKRRGVLFLATALLAGDALSGGGCVAAAVVAILAGCGASALARRILARGAAAIGGPSVAGALGFVVVVQPLAIGPRPAGDATTRWAQAALAEAPPRALLVPVSDELSGGLAYAQAAWGARPDVTVLDRRRLADGAWLEGAAARGGFESLSADEAAAWRSRPLRSREGEQGALLGRLIARALPLRGALWEGGADPPPIGALEPEVPLDRLAPAPAALPPARPLSDRIAALTEGGGPDGDRLAARALAQIGADYLARGDDPRAAALFDQALARAPSPAATVGLAEVRSRRGDLRGALALVAPLGEREAVLAAARYRLALGDLDGAERDFARARASDRDARALTGLARVAHARGDDPRARALIDQALAAAPDDLEARRLAPLLGE